MTDLSRPWTRTAAFSSRAIFSTLRLLRHLADRAVQSGLFELLSPSLLHRPGISP